MYFRLWKLIRELSHFLFVFLWPLYIIIYAVYYMIFVNSCVFFEMFALSAFQFCRSVTSSVTYISLYLSTRKSSFPRIYETPCMISVVIFNYPHLCFPSSQIWSVPSGWSLPPPALVRTTFVSCPEASGKRLLLVLNPIMHSVRMVEFSLRKYWIVATH